jgi:hypothetical protein
MRDLKKPAESEALLRGGLALLEAAMDGEEVLGSSSRELAKATVINNLAFHYRHLELYEEALELYIQALVRCALSDRNLHSRKPLVPTSLRLKRTGV